MRGSRVLGQVLGLIAAASLVPCRVQVGEHVADAEIVDLIQQVQRLYSPLFRTLLSSFSYSALLLFVLYSP